MNITDEVTRKGNIMSLKPTKKVVDENCAKVNQQTAQNEGKRKP